MPTGIATAPPLTEFGKGRPGAAADQGSGLDRDDHFSSGAGVHPTCGALGPVGQSRGVMFLRLFYTAAVTVLIVWSLKSGRPLAGLLIVPAAAVRLRHEAESRRLVERFRRSSAP